MPRVYAEHALACKSEGYLAYKIHPHYFWNPETGSRRRGGRRTSRPTSRPATSCARRSAPTIVLMYDPWGTYMTMEEAIKVGRELEKLNFYWYEHPMPEYRVESYVRLCRELSIPILSPEIVAGGVFTRAEWILRGAGDMSRIDVVRGGITGARKTAIVCEAYGLRCEMHMAGWGNLQVCGATTEDTASTTRRACSRPASTTTRRTPTSRTTCDKIDADGYVTMPKGPGMGYEIDWDYIDDNLMNPEPAERTEDGAGHTDVEHQADRVDPGAAGAKGPLGVRAVAQQLELPLGSVHRLLLDLAEEGVVERTADGDWELSYRLLEITGLQLDRIAVAAPGAALRRADRRGDAGDGQRQRAQRRVRRLHRQGARQRGHAARHAASARAARSIAAAPARRCWR